MATLTPAQLVALAESVGLNPLGAATAAAVALAESGGRTDAIGDLDRQTAKWGPSVGLWQIRSLKAERGTGGTRDELALRDPRHNARSMAVISSMGSNFGAWTAFTTGAFRRYEDAVGYWQVVKGEAKQAGLGDADDILRGIAQDPTGAGADVLGALNPLDDLTDWTRTLGRILARLADPAFWRRIGVGVLGVALIIVALAILAREVLTRTAGDAIAATT